MIMNEPICCPVCGRVLIEDRKELMNRFVPEDREELVNRAIPSEGIQCPHCKNRVMKIGPLIMEEKDG